MILSPIVGLVFNTENKRWHPIYFVERPIPGGADDTGLAIRYKSGGHHLSGFNNRNAAFDEAVKLSKDLKEEALGSVRICLEKDFIWDGDEMPLFVVWFTREGRATQVLM